MPDFPLIPGLNTEEEKKEELKKNQSIDETKKKILADVLDTLSDREVDEYLQELGADTSGSVYNKRIRLKSLLQAHKVEKTKENSPESTPKKDPLPISIENASEAEFMQVDRNKSGVLVLRGRVRVKLNKGSLIADSLTVDSKRNEIYAEGNIEYEEGDLSARGNKFIYDTELQRGILYDTSAKVKTSFFVGKKIKKVDENKYLMDLGYFTACNAEIPHYSFKAKRIIVYENNTITASNIWFQVGSFKLFYLPLFYTTSLGSGWIVQAGRNNTQGSFLQTSYQWSEPLAALSLFSPIGRKVKLDYYEKTGQAFGLEFWKRSPWLNYRLDTGYAHYKRYEATSVYEKRFRAGGVGNTVTTNQVDKGDLCIKYGKKCLITAEELLYGTSGAHPIREYGVDEEYWWKVDLNANIKQNNAMNDGTRNIQIKMEEYKNPAYEYEFGYRYQPANTLQAIYTRRQQRSSYFKQNPIWDFDYSESRGDLSINIKATRMNNYAFLIPRGKSGYFPIYEEVPRVHIRNSSEIARFPLSEAPLYWDIDVLSSVQRYYSYPTRTPLPYSLGSLGYSDYYQDYKANLLRTEYFTKGETGFKTTLYLGSYISYDPSVYIGATKRSAEFTGDSSTRSASDIALERQLKRESYQYLRNNHVISIGVPALLFKTTYRRIQSIKSEIPEKTLEQSSDRFSPQNSQDRQHEAEFSLSSNAFESMEFSIITIRDLRRFSQSYKPEPENRERWYYTIFRMGSYYDFLEGFGNQKVSHLERKRSFFSGIFFNNDYIYHTTLKKKLYNNLTLGYQLGGFRLPFIRRFKKLEAGGSWYHVFEAAYLDAYRVYLQTDLQITRFIGLEIELDSRVTQPWRYTNQVGGLSYYRNGQDPVAVTNSYSLSTDPAYSQSSFQRDLAYGSGVTGSNNRQTTALNINTFQFAFKHNLHNFDIRYGYSMNLRSIQGGLSMDKQVNFYDQSVFVTLSLTNIGFGDSSAFRDARARIYRFRKRPLDGGL